MTQFIDALKWLIGLAHPENLAKIVHTDDPQWWWVSYAIVAAIVFSETGLLVGFFLPGDSLLFGAGFLASQNLLNVGGLVAVLIVAAIVGDALNYYVGLQMGEYVFEKGRLRFVKHSHLLAAKAFYERHGGKAIVLARFIPLVRTFTPFVAGVARMGYQRFFVYNVLGGIGWVVSMTAAGYWLGQIEIVKKNFEIAIIGVVVISILPLAIKGLRHWLGAGAPVPEPPIPEPLE
jgi:membrane-associated protein